MTQKKRKFNYSCSEVLLIMLIAAVQSCSSNFIRTHVPVERYDIEVDSSSAVIRTEFCSVQIEHLEAGLKDEFFRTDFFSRQKDLRAVPAMPITLYFCVIKNTWKYPVVYNNAFLVYGNKKVPALNSAELRRMYPPEIYAYSKNKNLFTRYRVMGDSFHASAVFKNRNLVRYTYNFIAPGDSAGMVLMFPLIPVEYKKYTVRVQVTSMKTEKMVDLDFTRFEYRSEGFFFRAPDTGTAINRIKK